jgi:sigma-B regulation protein RsbU (phosphoserine phosphatase)
MGKFTLVLVIPWILRTFLLPATVRQSLPPAIQWGLDLSTVLLAGPAIYYLWKLFDIARGKLLWKIRRRLILAHILIAAIPIVLVVVILYVSGLLFFYQLSYFLIERQIGIHTGQILAFNLSTNSNLKQVMSSPASHPALLKTVLDRDAKYLLGMYRTASIVLRVKDPESDRFLVYGVGNVWPNFSDYLVPPWIPDSGFNGLVYEDLQPAIYQDPKGEAGKSGRLHLRSLVTGEFRPGLPYSLEISVPFDGIMLEHLSKALGQDLVIAHHVPSTGLGVMMQDTRSLDKSILYATFSLDEIRESTGRSVWSMPLYPVFWSNGTDIKPSESGTAASTEADIEVLFIELSTSKLIQNVFRSESNVSTTILGALELVVGFFLAVELLSLIGGIILTKSITSAVYSLDRGTEFIRRGDFSQRIVVKSDDQLGALAKSFNQMTEYIQTLVKERVQKERLERELEIAKEVQEQLFPKRAPQMSRMELTGLCLPARIVSGDYYDFLQFDDRRMGIALGDICGKGISAALLMANLQATLRSNVLARGAYAGSDPAAGNGNVAGVVKVLNQQIYSFTSANKFASFFYAVYDDSQLLLTYCNAGHNPPLYFGAKGFRRLGTGGTVVGIFPDAEFEQESIQLQSGDIFVAYTDGIIECVSEYGEEFGEQRLIELVREKRHLSAEHLQKAIVDEVLGWAYEEERDDDMTLIVSRFH